MIPRWDRDEIEMRSRSNRDEIETNLRLNWGHLGLKPRWDWDKLKVELGSSWIENVKWTQRGLIRELYQWGTPPSHLDLVFSGPQYPRRLIPLSTPYQILINSISHPYHIHITSISNPYQIHIRSISDPYQIYIKSISNPYLIHMNIWEGRGYPIERVPHWYSSLN